MSNLKELKKNMDGKMTITDSFNIYELDLADVNNYTIQEIIDKLEKIKKEHEDKYDKIIIKFHDRSEFDNCLWPSLIIEGQNISSCKVIK